jgi:hypothetical protein
MLAALWESFRSRTPAQRLAHARIRLAQADALERAALREWDRFNQHLATAIAVTGVPVPKKLDRRMRRMNRRLRRLNKRTDRWARIVGALDEAVVR